jgi:flagella basal body P-ring formation protein FlgA
MTVSKKFAAALLLFGLFATSAATAAVHPVTLRPAITVDGPEVTVGDLFTGAEETADITVSVAPAPGKKLYFKASYVAAVARRVGLHWRVPPGLQRVVVTRASQVVPHEEIVNAITDALGAYLEPNTFDVQISSRYLMLHVAPNDMPTVAVENMNFDQRSGRFTAAVLAPASDPTAVRTRISGRAFKVAEIPVLNRRMTTGEVIGAGDIEWVKVRSGRLSRNIIRNDDELIGMSIRRGSRVGRPVRVTDVQRPVVVAKGSKVVMELNTSFMSLSAAGRAMENGGQGDLVRVRNLRSHKVVEGTVIAPGKIAVDLVTNKIAVNDQ